MSTCAGCGGVLGRDCWNEADCVWISQDMAMRAAIPPEPQPCQGCHYITGRMIACLGLCIGMTCLEDADARAEAYAAISTTVATNPTHATHTTEAHDAPEES